MRLLYFLIGLVVFASCKQSSKDKELLITEINNYVRQVNDNEPTFRYVKIDKFNIGDDTAKLEIGFKGDNPIIINYFSRIAPGNRWQFYLSEKKNDVIYFLETGLDLAAGHRFQNRFYYNRHKLIVGQTAIVGCDHAEHLHNNEWSDYIPRNKDADFRLSYGALMALIKKALKEAEK